MPIPLKKLTSTEIEHALNEHALTAWKIEDDTITRTLKTRDWRATMMVANAIAYVCETAWHHPQLTLTFSQIVIRLDTHDVDGVSVRDIELAVRLEAMLGLSKPEIELEGTLRTQSLLSL